MSSPMTADAVLEREFLKARAKILEVGAILDRIDRSSGTIESDRRAHLLRKGLEELLSNDPGRAERIQSIFSLPYEEKWREKFELV